MPILKDDIIHLRFGLIPKGHTGRKLHRSHTSWPLVAAMLLMVGVLLTATTMQVRAASVTVNAKANGPHPVTPAIILSPEDGSSFSLAPIPVTGTCEAGYYVKLYRNDIFSGSALCTPGGTFSIISDLFIGRNDLVARTFNAADDEGPASGTVTLWYAPGEIATGEDAPNDGGFYLTTEYFFKAAYSGQKLTWDFNIVGGHSPYTAYATWGDGYSDMQTGLGGGKVWFEHAYKTPKDQREYYTVIIRLVDSVGRSTTLQLVAIMNDRTIISGALVRPNDPSPFNPVGWLSGTLKGIWSVYGVVVLMGVCFWLGERRGESLAAAWYRRKLRRRQQRA